jgi:glutamine synthetase type III
MFVNILIKCKEGYYYPRLRQYFLIDRSLAESRPDLMTGRTLLGHTSAKGQQLDDHYFGSIPTRALYMRDLEQECMLLGIPVKRVTMSSTKTNLSLHLFSKKQICGRS